MPPQQDTTAASPTPAARPQVILVVDDEPEIRSTLAGTLRRAMPHLRVLTAENAEEGLRILADHQVDLILSDHRMPGMSGIEFLVEARRRQPSAARVIMTAHPETDVVVRGINDAMLGRFLTKPFRTADVVATLRQVLDERHAGLLKEAAFARAMFLLQRSDEAAPAGAPIP